MDWMEERNGASKKFEWGWRKAFGGRGLRLLSLSCIAEM